ncbi:MAG: hypothetical protein CL927_16765 [Deltaproteobacteria bacterium]|nr:hypothetical protein [Deltaproteobacteria bacterium]HCH62888.1 hypothetical protein [Deltaproteobacteria bacterium]
MPPRPATSALAFFWPTLGLAVGLAGATACSTGPAGPEDCRSMAAGSARDECWATHAPALFRTATSPEEAVAVIEKQVGDAQVRDFIWLTITREVDPSSFTYCKKIDERALAERCRVLVSRPHLHRELVGGGGGGGKNHKAGPGGPPPGAGPGGPPPGGGPPPPPGERTPAGDNPPAP